MSRNCPVCPAEAMRMVPSGGVVIDVCPRCAGMWFDRGELELFPDRPSSRVFLAAARTAGSRCKKLGHLVPAAMAACAGCRSAPVACPACRGRLALVPTPRCVIDVCVHCEGVWLDAGEF